MPILNERAWELCDEMAADADALGITVSTLSCGTRLIDCGVKSEGSVEAGLQLAGVCMAGEGRARIRYADSNAGKAPRVFTTALAPVAACMASQYAGWEIKGDEYFAMGSGPMRAAAGREALFQSIGHREKADRCVGVLETSKLPPESVCIDIANKCGIAPEGLTLLAARTSSAAGMVQIVARSVETAMHKLHTLGFELDRIEHGFGWAPLPPLCGDDLAAIGRTNDAILYDGHALLFVHGDDAPLKEVGPRVPSNSSLEFGRPFAEILEHCGGDFYRIDPMLFSPAVVRFYNVDTGNSFRFGSTAPEVLSKSFAKK
jgi:methenyltetrahydromethanopterin cyclohydrolase